MLIVSQNKAKFAMVSHYLNNRKIKKSFETDKEKSLSMLRFNQCLVSDLNFESLSH